MSPRLAKPRRKKALGRGVLDITAPRRDFPFTHITHQQTNLPPPRKLSCSQVRETGPRPGVSFRLWPWHHIKPTEGTLSALSVTRLLSRLLP